ncbi:MAG: hypothetical protein ACE5JN_01440 [Candidatus Methylomirabilia bacterium]
MAKHKLGWVALAVGLILALLSALADPLGLGGSPGVGWKQSLGVIVGIVLIVVGQYWRRKPGTSR